MIKVNHEARAAAAARRRGQTRARLIEAAMRVVAARGPDAVSISEVAAEAGVSRGVLYNYFPGLEDLVVAVGEKISDDLDLELAAEVAHLDDPAERILRGCLGFIERGIRDPVWGWVRLRLDGSSAAPPAVVVARFTELHVRAVAQGRMRPSPTMAALSLVTGAVRMAVRAALTMPDPPPNLAEETARLVVIGLGVAPDETEAMLVRARQDRGRPAAPEQLGARQH